MHHQFHSRQSQSIAKNTTIQTSHYWDFWSEQVNMARIKKGVDRRVFRQCRNPGLNQGPLDLQSNALPTELFRPTRYKGAAHHLDGPIFCDFCELYIRFDFPISNAVENTNMHYPLKNTSQIQLYLIYSVSAFSIISKFSCVGRESNPDRLLGRQPC